MRINGFEQIKAFYSWSFENQERGIKSQHISLYMFLINQNNRNSWVEWFKLPMDLGMAGSCISSKKTYYACLSDLQLWGLIEYQKGINDWKAPLIKLEVLKDTATIPQSEPQVLPLIVPQVHTLDTPQLLLQLATQPIPNIKLLTNNFKLVTENIEEVLLFLETNRKEENISPEFRLVKEQLIDDLIIMFGFNEERFNVNKRSISSFVKTKLKNQTDIDNFILQYKNYKEYKKLSGEAEHNFVSYLGTPAMQFNNSAWNSENWGMKLEQYKSKNTNKTKFDKLKDAYNTPNPYAADEQGN